MEQYITLPSPSNQSTLILHLIFSRSLDDSDTDNDRLNGPKSWWTIFAAARMSFLPSSLWYFKIARTNRSSPANLAEAVTCVEGTWSWTGISRSLGIWDAWDEEAIAELGLIVTVFPKILCSRAFWQIEHFSSFLIEELKLNSQFVKKPGYEVFWGPPTYDVVTKHNASSALKPSQ